VCEVTSNEKQQYYGQTSAKQAYELWCNNIHALILGFGLNFIPAHTVDIVQVSRQKKIGMCQEHQPKTKETEIETEICMYTAGTLM